MFAFSEKGFYIIINTIVLKLFNIKQKMNNNA